MKVLDLFNLKGKTAVVTGCNKGIGMSMALALAEAGADIIGVSASIELSGSEIEKMVQAAGRNFKAYQCDFSDRGSLKSFIAKLNDEVSRIDILVNNAGMISRAPVAEYSDESWDKVLSVNLDAPFILTREIGKKMLEQGSGKIIFTASLLSFQGGVLVPGYAASKGAISSLIKAFANEWAGKGININGIAPGYIATDNTEALRNDPERSKSILSRIPANRWGEPADLKGITVFLASAASDYMNGTIVTVDGGWMGR